MPSFQDYRGGEGRINRYYQAIFPNYQFQCCGNVTEWRVDVDPGGRMDDGQYTLNLQVWRPSPTVDNTYNLVGYNRFPTLSLSGGGAVVISPSPGDYIPVQSGDVLGVHVESAKDNNGGLVVLTTDTYTRDSVWLASVTSQLGDCPVSIGNNGQLNTLLQGAPVITADASESIL